jgi:hypothetical protein
MLSLHGLSLVLQLGVPLVLLGWFALGRNRSISGSLVRGAVVLLYLAGIHLAGVWLLLPWYTAIIFAAMVVLLALSQIHRLRQLPWRSPRIGWRPVATRSVVAAAATAAIAGALQGRRPPPGTLVDLQFPLRRGVYHVVGAGSAELVNPHLMTLEEERFRTYRGQSHGVDLVKLGPLGLRAAGPLPTDLNAYAIYGEPVHAPCPGRVVQVQDGMPDMPPPVPDRTRLPGNHVLLDCDGIHVLLAHLQPGSVRVAQGAQVEAGSVVGRVGNSGNSNEPHLHVHAQRPARTGQEPLSGDPLPIQFDGRYLVRNDRVRR